MHVNENILFFFFLPVHVCNNHSYMVAGGIWGKQEKTTAPLPQVNRAAIL